ADVTAGLGHLRWQRQGSAAVDVVDRIGQQQHLQVRYHLLARDQTVGELAAERTMRRAGRAHQLVEQKEVGDDEGARLVDDPENFIEDALLVDRLVRLLRLRAR